MKQTEPFESETEAKKNVVQAIKTVAKELGNLYSTCRKYYVHPAIIDTYLKGKLGEIMAKYDKSKSKNSPQGLRSEERAVVGVLEKSIP